MSLGAISKKWTSPLFPLNSIFALIYLTKYDFVFILETHKSHQDTTLGP